MKEFILSITPQEWITFAGIALTAIAGIVTAIISKTGQKNSDGQNKTLISIVGTIVEALGDLKGSSDTVKTISDETAGKVDNFVTNMKQSLADNKIQNAAVASFVLECFKQSNLSDEKKANLQVLFDQLFYDDKSELITVLQSEKTEAEAAVKERDEEIENLKAKLENLNLQLQNAAVTKKSRRL